MKQFSTILWQDYLLFKAKFWTITTGSMIGPILYLIAFGWGIGSNMKMGGTNYINFVIPGIIALGSMTSSFSTIANNINISRLYEKTFEEFMTAPVNMLVFAAGRITGGALRGIYSSVLIIILSFLFNTGLKFTPYFFLILILNCFAFSALGFTAGIVINSHADMGKFTNFVITPMSFLCGTFFPLDKMPFILKEIIWLLPLTHTSLGLRSTGESLADMSVHVIILAVYFIIFMTIGVKLCKKAE